MTTRLLDRAASFRTSTNHVVMDSGLAFGAPERRTRRGRGSFVPGYALIREAQPVFGRPQPRQRVDRRSAKTVDLDAGHRDLLPYLLEPVGKVVQQVAYALMFHAPSESSPTRWNLPPLDRGVAPRIAW